jgi:hypothetical protein
MGEMIAVKLRKIKKRSNIDLKKSFREYFKNGMAKSFFTKDELEAILKNTGKYIQPTFVENLKPDK